MRGCDFEGCEKPHRARGLCSGHYQQQRTGRELVAIAGERVRPLRSEPADSIDAAFRSRIEVTDGCWLWSGATVRGYGMLKYRGRRIYAHRYALESLGFNLEGLLVDHLCHRTICVRPSHLRPATNGMNQQNLAGARSNSRSGVLGVYWDSRDARWRAAVKADGATVRRSFRELQDAASWAAETRERVHYPRRSPVEDGPEA